MSGLNFNSTDNKPNTIKDFDYSQVSLVDSSTNNDYDLLGNSNLNIRAGNGATITGIAPEFAGQVLTITNIIAPGRLVRLQHLGDGSIDANKMNLTAVGGGSNLDIEYLNTAVLKYNDFISKWVLVSYSKT